MIGKKRISCSTIALLVIQHIRPVIHSGEQPVMLLGLVSRPQGSNPRGYHTSGWSPLSGSCHGPCFGKPSPLGSDHALQKRADHIGASLWAPELEFLCLLSQILNAQVNQLSKRVHGHPNARRRTLGLALGRSLRFRTSSLAYAWAAWTWCSRRCSCCCILLGRRFARFRILPD